MKRIIVPVLALTSCLSLWAMEKREEAVETPRAETPKNTDFDLVELFDELGSGQAAHPIEHEPEDPFFEDLNAFKERLQLATTASLPNVEPS